MITESLLIRNNEKKSKLVNLLGFPKRVIKIFKEIEKTTQEQTHYSKLEEKRNNQYVFDKHKQIIIPINEIENCQNFEYAPINATYQGNCNSSSCNENLQFKLMDDTLCKRYGPTLPMAPILKEK